MKTNPEIEYRMSIPSWGGHCGREHIEKTWAQDYARAIDTQPEAYRHCVICLEQNYFVDDYGFFQGGWNPKTKKFMDHLGAMCRHCTDALKLDFGER